MPTLNINGLFGPRIVDLPEDGSINVFVEAAFTLGHCHSFALAAARATGWRLAGCQWTASDEFQDCDVPEWVEAIPEHVLLLHPDGWPIDITGKRADLYDVMEVDEAFVRDLHAWGLYRAPEVEIAAKYVPAWINNIRRPS
jgi:hypothetical protein